MLTDWNNRVFCSDALEGLTHLPTGAVDCIVTSPPYYRQRQYASRNEIGQEATADAYVQTLQTVFRECYRVLAEEGTLWLNIGDKYEDGELLGLPWRVALTLKSDGWRLRSDIIWHKPNAMPSSVKNRPTVDHEYLFLFSKSKTYTYNADAIREPHVTFSENSKMRGGRNHFGKVNGTPEQGKNGGNANLHNGRWDQAFHPKGRNRRTVWTIPLSKFRETHFAVFPEQLVTLCIQAGCAEGGIVLDPFLGSGTTAVVSQKLGRRYVGIDSNPHYCAMAEKRLRQVALL